MGLWKLHYRFVFVSLLVLNVCYTKFVWCTNVLFASFCTIIHLIVENLLFAMNLLCNFVHLGCVRFASTVFCGLHEILWRCSFCLHGNLWTPQTSTKLHNLLQLKSRKGPGFLWIFPSLVRKCSRRVTNWIVLQCTVLCGSTCARSGEWSSFGLAATPAIIYG